MHRPGGVRWRLLLHFADKGTLTSFTDLSIALTMTGFDHMSFPHLVDLIFVYAPFKSLLVLRHVCREWRTRVDAEFYHLRNFWAEVRTEDVEEGRRTYRYHYQTASRKRCSVSKLVGYDSTEIVDLGPKVYKWPPINIRIDTLRFLYPHCSPRRNGPPTALAPARLVFDHHFDAEAPYHDDIAKLVVNYRNDRFHIMGNHGPRVNELVFIVHGGKPLITAAWGKDGRTVFNANDQRIRSTSGQESPPRSPMSLPLSTTKRSGATLISRS